jgi:hypothetical protein
MVNKSWTYQQVDERIYTSVRDEVLKTDAKVLYILTVSEAYEDRFLEARKLIAVIDESFRAQREFVKNHKN